MNTTKMRFDRITREEGAIAAFLIEYTLKKVAKIFAVIAGVFFAYYASNQIQKGAGRK